METSSEYIPPPRFKVKQTVYARDIETTGILYYAIIRKCQYGPKSKQLNVALHLAEGGKLTDVINMHEPAQRDDMNQQEDTWHYFIHHYGWSVKWDRWVEESNIYEDDEKGKRLANSLRVAQLDIVKRERKDKCLLAVYRRSKELEREIYGDSIQPECEEINKQEAPKKAITTKRAAKQSLEEWVASEKQLRSMALEGARYPSSNQSSSSPDQDHSLTLPFPLKKILTEEWEVISCGNYHTVPATISVHQVLNAYFHSKVFIITAGEDSHADNSEKHGTERHDGAMQGLNTKEYSAEEIKELTELYPSLSPVHDMVDGLKLLFDQALSRQLLFKQEIAQYLVLKNSDVFAMKTPCEVYCSEYLLRLLIRLPMMLEDGLERKLFQQDQVASVLYRLGDLIRFLQRDPEKYFAQSVRRRNPDEINMEKKITKSEVLKAEKRMLLSTTKEEEEKRDDSNDGKMTSLCLVKDAETPHEDMDPGTIRRTRSSKRLRQ